MSATAGATHKWEFKARFRRDAFGWRSQPAVQRVKAVSEIKKVVRRDPVLAAEGAVTLLERISPALEQVDSSSGAIGTAVNNAIAELMPIIAGADADPKTRGDWLDRLWAAHEADQMPYIERLADYWGELCAWSEVASAWADELVETTRLALSPDEGVRSFFHGGHGVPQRPLQRRTIRGDPRHPAGRRHLVLPALGGQGNGCDGQEVRGDPARRVLPGTLDARRGRRLDLRGDLAVVRAARQPGRHRTRPPVRSSKTSSRRLRATRASPRLTTEPARWASSAAGSWTGAALSFGHRPNSDTTL